MPEANAHANQKLDAAIAIYRRCGAGERWVERVAADRSRTSPPTPSPNEVVEQIPIAKGDAIFRREGDYWMIAYDGRIIRLKDIKGLSYIAHLLRHPDQEFHSLSLIGGGETSEDQDAHAGAQTAAAGLAEGLGDAGEMLDAQAKAAYKCRLDELRDELDNAKELGNENRAVAAEEEIDSVTQELSRAVGLGGRDRRAASASERARLNVTRAIKAAVARIAEEDAALGGLLGTTIRTGTFCSYTPDARFRINWQL